MPEDELDIYPNERDVSFRLGYLSGLQLLDAARDGNLSLCKEILEAPVRERGMVLLRLLGKDSDGNTARHLAAKNGHVEIVRYLIEEGFSVEAKNKRGDTVRMVARKKRQ